MTSPSIRLPLGRAVPRFAERQPRRTRRHDRRPLPRRRTPLYEALGIGLGCDGIGHRFDPEPEWR